MLEIGILTDGNFLNERERAGGSGGMGSSYELKKPKPIVNVDYLYQNTKPKIKILIEEPK